MNLFRLNNDGEVILRNPFPKGISVTEALHLSIQKWEFIVDCLKDGLTIKSDRGLQTCALCYKFNKTDFRGIVCTGCPVKIRSGYAYCAYTPYTRWSEDHSLDNAVKELAFLQSLRENYE